MSRPRCPVCRLFHEPHEDIELGWHTFETGAAHIAFCIAIDPGDYQIHPRRRRPHGMMREIMTLCGSTWSIGGHRGYEPSVPPRTCKVCRSRVLKMHTQQEVVT